jgi:hypothetical protein
MGAGEWQKSSSIANKSGEAINVGHCFVFKTFFF